MASTAVQGFDDPYSYSLADQKNFTGTGNASVSQEWGTSGLPGWLMKLVGLDMDKTYDEWMTRQNQEYERASINSARAWSEYMDNTQYQRRVEDLKKAGLNPWLAVQNGISGSGAATADTGGSAKHQTKSDQSLSGLGALLMAIAKIIG